MKQQLMAACVLLLTTLTGSAKDYRLQSPSGGLQIEVSANDSVTYSLSIGGKRVLLPSRIALTLDDGTRLGRNVRVVGSQTRNIRESFVAPNYRQNHLETQYSLLKLSFSGRYGLEFRAYDDGVAYRFYTERKDSLRIADETVEFDFAENYPMTIPYADRRNDIYESSFESQYTRERIGDCRSHTDRLAFLPILVDVGQQGRLLLAESDVEDYPGLFVTFSAGRTGLRGLFPPRPETVRITGSGSKRPETYGDIIACTSGRRTFPWRVIGYAADDSGLPVNNMVYQTASPNRIGSTEWIRPGRASWDWWNGVRLYGVDFQAGINTATYKYHIDFAAQFGLQYVLIDDGWYSYSDKNLLHPIPEVDIPELCRYAAEKGVRILLWAVGNTLLNSAEEVCAHYAAMGVAGFKVDFFDAQDQELVRDIYKLAEVTARHHLMLDLHGIYKPTGLNRTYPNVVNFEGVFGLEQLKWTDRDKADMPLNDVLLPYIRMASGPMDYTQGAMLNATKSNFRAIDQAPMSQGTRAHQVATYIVFDSPLVMLCDTPSNYIRQEQTTHFICSIPTVFDATSVLSGRAGEHIVIARRKGETWYVGGLTSWQPRTVEVDLSMLGEGEWSARIFRDGANSDRVAEDYTVENRTVRSGDKLAIAMASGGGFAIILERK